MFKETTPQERLELLLDTLRLGSSSQLDLSDDDLAGSLYTDLDTGTISFLHSSNLDLLLAARLIPPAICHPCASIRERVRHVIDNSIYPVTGQYVREDAEWVKIRSLCDEVLDAYRNWSKT